MTGPAAAPLGANPASGAATLKQLLDVWDLAAERMIIAVARRLARGITTDGWAERIPVGRRARHPARTDSEVRAADAWQFELIHKPLDAFMTRYILRPLARPLTRILLRTPLTPNMISFLSMIFGSSVAIPLWQREQSFTCGWGEAGGRP